LAVARAGAEIYDRSPGHFDVVLNLQKGLFGGIAEDFPNRGSRGGRRFGLSDLDRRIRHGVLVKKTSREA
jgi:hypothetical protein